MSSDTRTILNGCSYSYLPIFLQNLAAGDMTIIKTANFEKILEDMKGYRGPIIVIFTHLEDYENNMKKESNFANMKKLMENLNRELKNIMENFQKKFKPNEVKFFFYEKPPEQPETTETQTG